MLDEFIFLINKRRLFIYEVINDKIKLFKVKGHNFYDIGSLQSSVRELSNYMLERLNYKDFSSCDFKIVYSDIETKIFNLLINEFLNCSEWEFIKIKSILPNILLKSKLLLPTESKIIKYKKTKWEVGLSKNNIIDTKEVADKNNFDIELSNENILNYFSKDYSAMVNNESIDLFFDYDIYLNNYKLDISYQDQKYEGEYSGFIKDGEPHGLGTFVSSDFDLDKFSGIKYNGQWENGLFDKWGIIIDRELKYYAEFQKGKMNTVGIIYDLKESSKSISELNNGEIEGLSLGKLNNGNKFLGEIKDGEFSGLKILLKADGYKEIGEFDSNIQDGISFILDTDGKKFLGEFKSGNPDGICMLKDKNGGKSLFDFDDEDFKILRDKNKLGFDDVKNNVSKVKENVNESISKSIDKLKNLF